MLPRNSELLKRFVRPACFSAALLAALSGCERGRVFDDNPRDSRDRSSQNDRNDRSDRNERDRDDRSDRYDRTTSQGPRNWKTLSVDEGEALPNPGDSSNGPSGGRSVANTTRSGSGSRDSGGDQTLFILAGIAQEHDRFKQTVKEMETRHGEFLPVQQEHAKQIKQITTVTVPKLEQQVAAQQVESAKLIQGHGALEQRVAALEEELRQLKGGRSNPPASPVIDETPDEPHRALPSPHVKPSLPKTSQGVPPSKPATDVPSAPASPHISNVTVPAAPEPKKVSRFTPQQLAIRAKVRGIYERVIADFPGTNQAFDALMSLGAMAEEDEDWPSAVKVYEIAATEFTNRPESINARFHLGRVHAASGNYPSAREAFLIIPDWNPNHPMATSALLQAGVALAKSGKLDAGVRELRHIEKTQPGTTFAQDAREQIVSLYFDNKRYDETLACFPEVSENARPARKLELQLVKAQAERQAKKYKEAADTLNEIFKAQASPDVRSGAKFEFADLMDEQNKTLDAARAFSDAAQEFPQNKRAIEARVKASQLFLSNELPETSAEQMQELIKSLKDRPAAEREATEPEALFLLAKSQQAAAQSDAARKTQDELRRKYPAHPRALSIEVEEARGLAERGAVKDATAILRTMIRNHPDAPQTAQAMLLLAELQERNTDRLQRADAYSDLLKQTAGSDDANVLDLRRGLLLMELERAPEAAAVFARIADNDRAKPDIRLIARYQAAIAQQQCGQLEAAIKSYTQFVDGSSAPLDPAPKNLPALVNDAKWKIDKLKWLKDLTSAPTPAKSAPPKSPTGEPLPVLKPPPRTQTM